jgi:hypothetical protein
VNSKSPRSAGQMHGFPAEFDTYRLGGGRTRARTWDPIIENRAHYTTIGENGEDRRRRPNYLRKQQTVTSRAVTPLITPTSRCKAAKLLFFNAKLENIGGRTRARTWDPMIKSHLLYQLSYAPGTGPEKPSQEGVV